MSFFSKLFGKPKDDPLKSAMQMIFRLVDDEEHQNTLIPEPLAQLIKGGVACDEVPGASGSFGFASSNPIPVNGSIGELAYLSRLETTQGERILFHRIGAINTIDVFEAVTYSGGAWFVFFLDMYHPRRSRKAPAGFRIAPEPRQFSGFHSHCPEFPYDFGRAMQEAPELLQMAYIPLSRVTPQIDRRAFNRPSSHVAKLDSVGRQLTTVLRGGLRMRNAGPSASKTPSTAPPAPDDERSAPSSQQPPAPKAFHDIPMPEPSAAFADCWQAAGRPLNAQGQGAISWLRAHLHPPVLEHLSFRLGNQLFFISLDAEQIAPFSDADARALQTVASGCRGHACVMPMRRTSTGWSAAAPGWGLLDMATRRPIDPPALVTDDNIEMSDWELQDFAVQVVRKQLEKEGREIMSWQGNPEVHPSLWFVGDDGPEWVVVCAVRYPEREAAPPSNWNRIADGCRRLSRTGHFASVAVANADDPFDPARGSALPLWRGHGMVVAYDGLKPGPDVTH